MSDEALRVLLVLTPFFVAPVAGVAGGRSAGATSLLAIVPAALTAYFLFLFTQVSATGPFRAGVPWVSSLGLTLSFHFDGLGLLFATLITGIGTLIVLYAAKYLEAHAHAARFQVVLFAFMGSMLGLVLSDNLIALFVFWELTGFTSYLLIGFEHERREARRAGLQALLVTGSGGLALLAAALLLSQIGGSTSLFDLLRMPLSLAAHPLYIAVSSLVLLAAFTKSAQFPFHFWLPNAMQAPTPVSAYLHSATMVKAGVYLVARMTPLLGGTPFWMTVTMSAGALTMIGGSYRAMLETDLKRVLAYSTISALGVLMLLLGAGSREAIAASLVYLVAHACYKGALFLVAGAIEHETGTREVTRLGGLRSRMPVTAAAAGLAALSMAGVPLFLGFVAKEQFYEAVGHLDAVPIWPWLLPAAAIGASALLGAAGLIVGVGPFIGRATDSAHVHEPPFALWIGPLTLGVFGIVLGCYPALVTMPLTLAVTAIAGEPTPIALTAWHGVTWTLGLSLLTLAGTTVLFVSRTTVRRVAWPRALHTEGLYSWTLAAADGVSVHIAPLLQSKSLRSYALVIIVTAVTLLSSALITGRVLPAPSRWTPILFHEGLIVLFIIGAAISATVARSTMAAVLSLGAVGYGVALMYALFGAPDLAMTQFAVETLTVVIFVLVFRQMRGFGELSTRAVRARDATVAIAAGALVSTLVLFIGASGTTSRLSEYFTEAAPTLGHGRNVVNVILVDFREFDTMGEITVLVTVAVGVRALLNIGSGRRG